MLRVVHDQDEHEQAARDGDEAGEESAGVVDLDELCRLAASLGADGNSKA